MQTYKWTEAYGQIMKQLFHPQNLMKLCFQRYSVHKVQVRCDRSILEPLDFTGLVLFFVLIYPGSTKGATKRGCFKRKSQKDTTMRPKPQVRRHGRMRVCERLEIKSLHMIGHIQGNEECEGVRKEADYRDAHA